MSQKKLKLIISNIKNILAEGISKSKYLVDNSAKKISSQSNSSIINLNNVTCNNLNESAMITSKKIEIIIRFCSFIDNLTSDISQFLNAKNKNKLQNLLEQKDNLLNNNTVSPNGNCNTFNNRAFYNHTNESQKKLNSHNMNTKSPFVNNNKDNEFENTNFITYNDCNREKYNSSENYLNPNYSTNVGISNANTENNNFSYLQFDSYKRQSIYKSLFKNCKNTLDEIIFICSKIKDDTNIKVNDSVSSIVNNLTNNINFNFNFNVPKFETSAKSQEFKNNASILKRDNKKETNSKNTNNNNNDSNNFAKQPQNNDLNKSQSYNKNNHNNNNNNNKNLNLKSSNFTDYSAVDEINENKLNLKISAFNNNKPNILFSSKLKKLDNDYDLPLTSHKKRAKSVDSYYDEINHQLNTNLSNKLILITANNDISNTIVNDEIISSVKLPISKIRSVTLENYNKNGKIFVTKYVNVNSKNLFKRLASKNEKEFDMDVSVNNLNNSYELDNKNSKKLFTSFFKKDSMRKVNISNCNINSNATNSNNINLFSSEKHEVSNFKPEYFLINKFTDNNIEEEEDCIVEEEEDSCENCNLDVSDDENNFHNLIKIKTKKMMQKFLFNGTNNNHNNNNNSLHNSNSKVNNSNICKKPKHSSGKKKCLKNEADLPAGSTTHLNPSNNNLINNNQINNYNNSNRNCDEITKKTLNFSEAQNDAILKNMHSYNSSSNSNIYNLKDLTLKKNNIKSYINTVNNNTININSYTNNQNFDCNLASDTNLEHITKCYETLVSKDIYKTPLQGLSISKTTNK